MIPIRRPNIPIALLSIAMSVGLWVHVQQMADSDKKPTPVRLKLKEVGLDESRLSLATIPKAVPAKVFGTSDDAEQVKNSEDVYALVDLTHVFVGEKHAYPLKLITGTSKANVTLDNMTVTLTIERIARRKINVSVVTKGLLPDPNLQYADSLTYPTDVTIEGPKSQVDAVNEIRALLDLSKVQPNTAYDVKVEALDARDQPMASDMITIDPPQVSIQPALMPSPQQKAVIVNPVFVGTAAFGYRVVGVNVTPNQIFVQGSSIDISRMSTIGTRPINIEGLKATTQYTSAPDLPLGVSVVRDKPDTVIVTVTVEPVPVDTTAKPPSTTGGTPGKTGPG